MMNNRRIRNLLVWTVLLFIGAGVLLFAATRLYNAYWLLPSETVTVTGHSWERRASIREYTLEEAWMFGHHDDLEDAFTTTRLFGYRPEPDDFATGECRPVEEGDGLVNHYECDITNYTRRAWVYRNTIIRDREGRDPGNPGSPHPDCNSVSDSPEPGDFCTDYETQTRYWVLFEDEDGTPHECYVDQATWDAATVGATYVGRFLDDRLQCNLLEW